MAVVVGWSGVLLWWWWWWNGGGGGSDGGLGEDALAKRMTPSLAGEQPMTAGDAAGACCCISPCTVTRHWCECSRMQSSSHRPPT